MAIKIIADMMTEVLKELDYLSLKAKIEAYTGILEEISSLDKESEDNRTDIQFENGVALSTSFAAMCVDDLIRTRQFIRGTYHAISRLVDSQATPITALYAGTGPYAALMLPILTRFAPSQVQLRLMEVNPRSMARLKVVIRELALEDYVIDFVQEDASSYQINSSASIDLVLSETMQHALVREQQVPITLNLLSQVSEQAIMIPQNIRIDLSLMNSSNSVMLVADSTTRYKKLKTLFDFDRAFIRNYMEQRGDQHGSVYFSLCDRFPFRTDVEEDFNILVINTSIQVFEDEYIRTDESGLTVPKLLLDLNQTEDIYTSISLSYEVKNIPGYNIQFH